MQCGLLQERCHWLPRGLCCRQQWLLAVGIMPLAVTVFMLMVVIKSAPIAVDELLLTVIEVELNGTEFVPLVAKCTRLLTSGRLCWL